MEIKLLERIKGLNNPVMTDSMRNLYIPENHFAFHLSLCEASPSKKKKTKRAIADAQTDLRLCCSHIY